MVLNLLLLLGVLALVGIRALIVSMSARIRSRAPNPQSPLARRARALAVLQDLAAQPRPAATPPRREVTYGGIRMLDPASIPTNLRLLRSKRSTRSTARPGRNTVNRREVESRPTVAYLPTRPHSTHHGTPDVA